MSDSLPTPARTDRVTTGALDPTQVVLGPRPVQHSGTEETKVIVGEVLAGRHRAPRSRRRGPGPVGAAVLSATGIVAGLSLLLSQESLAGSASTVHEPAASAPDRAPDDAAPAPVAATAAVPVGRGDLVPVAQQDASAARPATGSAVSPHPASPNGPMTFQEWLQALQAAARQGATGSAPAGYPVGWPQVYSGPGHHNRPGMAPGGWLSESEGGD